jgi:hypothetical protein
VFLICKTRTVGLVDFQGHASSDRPCFNFQLPTLAAIGVESSRLPALFSLIGKFKRCAVLADENWLKAIGELEGDLIPGLEVKGFDPNNEMLAEAWLAKT